MINTWRKVTSVSGASHEGFFCHHTITFRKLLNSR